MRNEFEDELWEACLKTAVLENSLHEISGYPSEKELRKIILPEHYDKRMRRLIRNHCRRRDIAQSLRYGKKIASIVILIMGISFAALLSFDEVRAACRHVIVQIYERYVQFDFAAKDSGTADDVECTYLPEGYFLSDSTKNEYEVYLTYTNTPGDTIELHVFFQNSRTYIDNEHHIMSDVPINGNEGKFFDATDPRFDNLLVWHTDQGAFHLSSTLEKDVMIKIAENVK